MSGFAKAAGEAVRERRGRKTSRSMLLIAVVGVHVLVIALLLSESGTFELNVSKTVPISAVLLFPARRRRPRFRPGQLHAATPSAPITEPITLPVPAATTPLHVARAVNWARAARQAVSSVLHQPRHKTIAFGFPKGTHPRSALHSSASGVPSGEVYRTPTGQRVERISRHCYLESGPTPLGASSLQQQAQMSRVRCSGLFSTPKKNLFKNLPAYKRYHAALPKPHRHHRHRPVPPRPH